MVSWEALMGNESVGEIPDMCLSIACIALLARIYRNCVVLLPETG